MSTSTSSALSVNNSGALTIQDQLVAGSLLLEETDLAIDSSQAAELLTLWLAFRSLSSSDTAAQAEIDAVIVQIEDTMSTEQLEAIQSMQLSWEDLASIQQVDASQVRAALESSDGETSPTGSGPPGGLDGGGFGPGGGDGTAFLAPLAGGGTLLSAATTEVPGAQSMTSDRLSDRTARRLVDTLITLLGARAEA